MGGWQTLTKQWWFFLFRFVLSRVFPLPTKRQRVPALETTRAFRDHTTCPGGCGMKKKTQHNDRVGESLISPFALTISG